MLSRSESRIKINDETIWLAKISPQNQQVSKKETSNAFPGPAQLDEVAEKVNSQRSFVDCGD